MSIPATATRVVANTSRSVNERIHQMTEASIAHYAVHPDEVERRLEELDREWDTERTLEANAATLAFAGTLLGAFVNRWWLLLPAGVTMFLLQHAIQGWCPPLPVIRRLGIRTAREIEAERYALKAIRGEHADSTGNTRCQTQAMQAASNAG